MKTLLHVLTLLIVLTSIAVTGAAGVLDSAMDSPQGVVTARKGLMQALGANLKDMGAKIKDGRIEAVAVNAGTLSAVAAVLPPLYKEPHEGVYPVEGSKAFFKKGSVAAFENAAANMQAAADDIEAAAVKKETAGVSGGIETLKSSCGACHAAFRGKY